MRNVCSRFKGPVEQACAAEAVRAFCLIVAGLVLIGFNSRISVVLLAYAPLAILGAASLRILKRDARLCLLFLLFTLASGTAGIFVAEGVRGDDYSYLFIVLPILIPAAFWGHVLGRCIFKRIPWSSLGPLISLKASAWLSLFAALAFLPVTLFLTGAVSAAWSWACLIPFLFSLFALPFLFTVLLGELRLKKT